MDVTITLKCNNKCLFCPRNKYLKMISCESYPQIYSDIKKTRMVSDKIVLTGGEATLLPFIFDIIKFCKAQGFQSIGMVTNGRRLSDMGFARKIVALGVNDFAISLYSLKDEIHDSITMVDGSCKETKQGLLNMLRIGFKHPVSLRVNFVLNYLNYKDIFKSIIELYGRGLRHFIIADQLGRGKNEPGLSAVKIKNFLKSLQEIRLKGASFSLKSFPPCFFKEYNLMVGEMIVKGRNPVIVLEGQDVDTLVKRENKKRDYLSAFNKLFTKMEKCCRCTFDSQCLGIQKIYL